MSIGIDFSDMDLGFDPDIEIPEEDPNTTIASNPTGRNLVTQTTLAKALYSVWNGEPVTIVDSPPGAGKTTLIVQIVAYLKERSDLKMVIASPTKRGATDLAERIAAELGPDSDGHPQVAMTVYKTDPPAGVSKGGAHSGGKNIPLIRTIASCRKSPPECDIMIIDEAYQVPYSDAASAADCAFQVLMVGDPGQIGPVISADMSAFRGKSTAPHLRAPEVFKQIQGATILALDSTYRLGQETVDAIAPLYDFPFTSSRPDRYLTDEAGNRVSEIVPLVVPATSHESLDTQVKVARYAAGLIGVELVEVDADENESRRELEASDIAVVVAHNTQATGVQAVLKTIPGASGITVGTADRMQGGQWHAVVALDPLTGHSAAGTHQLSPGRLCVMASRHMTHLTWAYDENWDMALMDESIDQQEARLGRMVRDALTAI